MRKCLVASFGFILFVSAGIDAVGESSVEKLTGIGSHFRFAIVADPQVSAQTHRGKVGYNAMIETEHAAAEINAMDPRPDFVVHLGDLVNVFNAESEANYRRLAGLFDPPNILVHGNHDTHAPYGPFLRMQKELTGIDKPYSSFDVGDWHFIITPCNLGGKSAEDLKMEAEMLAWLGRDLEENKDRPTVFFNHLHFMPQGLSQTEFYHFPLNLRKKLLNLMTRYGNVKYYFNGHVHNGLQTAERSAWEYKGIRFFTVPTLIQPRPYGEEFAGFEAGIHRGGYYLIVDVNGDELTLRGRLSGVDKEYVFSRQFKEFSPDEFPRWFSSIPELPAKPALENASFSSGLNGWDLPERYNREKDPFFVADTGVFSEHQAVRLMIKSPVKSLWCEDEYYEVSQTVSVDPNQSLMIRGDYYIPDDFDVGGGYIAALLMSGEQFKGLMMFHWGKQEEFGNYLPRAYGYAVTGRQQSWLYFQQLGDRKEGMFWDLPQELNQWHTLKADISALYDQGHRAGAYRALGVDKVVFASGIWNYVKNYPSKTEAYYSNLMIRNGSSESVVDGADLSVSPLNFTCSFGQALADELADNGLKKYPVHIVGNLIANGDFSEVDKKSGEPLSWKKGRWKAFAETSPDAVSSHLSLKVNDSDGADVKKNAWWVSDRIGVEASSAYEVKWNWKFREASDAGLMVRYFDGNGTFLRQDRFAANGTQVDWRGETRSLKMPSGCRLLDVVLCTSGNGRGEIWLDDLEIIKQ